VLWRTLAAKPWRTVLWAGAAFAGCFVCGFVLATPFSVLDRHAFLAGVAEQARIAADLQRGSILDPARQAVSAAGWLHHAVFTLRHGLGSALLVTGVIGAVWLAWQWPRRALIVLAFPIVYYLVMGANRLVYARYMVPVVPFVALTTAFAIDRVVVSVSALGTTPIVEVTVLAAAIAGVAGPTATRAVAFDRLVSRPNARVRAARWIQNRFPSGATMYQTGVLYGHVQPRPSNRYAFRHLTATPDLIVVVESPLAVFNQAPAGLEAMLRADYVQAAVFKGIGDARDPPPIYDQQDAFYVPFANLTSVSAPGPTVHVFARRPLLTGHTDR
jgi:hypothetical protein